MKPPTPQQLPSALQTQAAAAPGSHRKPLPARTLAALRRAWETWRAPFLAGAFSILLCLTIWQLLSAYRVNFVIRFENVPPPTKVAIAFAQLLESPKFFSHISSSFIRIFAGFSIAAVLAVPVGMIIGRFQLGRHLLLPPLEVLRPIPAVAWIPLAILMFSTGQQSMIFITFIGAFFPILVSTIHGVESLDRRLIDASLTLGAGPLSVFLEVILPGALPSIVTGLSIGMGTAWFSLVTAEMIAGQFGIGYFTWEAYTLQNYPDIVLGMIIIGVLGMASSALIRGLGWLAMPWYKPGGNAI